MTANGKFENIPSNSEEEKKSEFSMGKHKKQQYTQAQRLHSAFFKALPSISRQSKNPPVQVSMHIYIFKSPKHTNLFIIVEKH